MTKDELYDIEKSVYGNIERIRREQAEYLAGVEHGANLMFKAVLAVIKKEEEQNNDGE